MKIRFLLLSAFLCCGLAHHALAQNPIPSPAMNQPKAKHVLSDAEKNASTQMNATDAQAAETHGQDVRIVFIGNSITIHAPAPGIGWTHDWGMAASAPEKDYVHIVTRGIEEKTGKQADVRIRNLAAFERHFNEYDFTKLQDLVDFKPDYLVVALGENVPALQTTEERLAYRDKFIQLLACFLKNDAKPKTVVRGVFWKNEWKDEMMSKAAKAQNVPFLKLNLSSDPSMKALGLFEHKGVQSHPGDKGMAEIANLILKVFFPK